MRWLLRVIVGLLVVVGLVAGLERYAAESGEVVVLQARNAAGDPVPTRLWVVDHDGRAYLRVGAGGSGWFDRLSADPRVAVTRASVSGQFVAVPDPAMSGAVNTLMRDKYGWRDAFIGALVGGRDGSIPIRLDPAGSHRPSVTPASETGSPAMRE